MRRTVLARPYFALLLLLGAAGVGHAQSVRACQPNDSTSSAAVRFANLVAADTSAFAIAERSEYGIPVTSPSAVVVVQADSVCHAATAALDAYATAARAQSLVTVRIGTGPYFYILARPSLGLLRTAFLLDNRFRVLTSYGIH